MKSTNTYAMSDLYTGTLPWIYYDIILCLTICAVSGIHVPKCASMHLRCHTYALFDSQDITHGLIAKNNYGILFHSLICMLLSKFYITYRTDLLDFRLLSRMLFLIIFVQTWTFSSSPAVILQISSRRYTSTIVVVMLVNWYLQMITAFSWMHFFSSIYFNGTILTDNDIKIVYCFQFSRACSY